MNPATYNTTLSRILEIANYSGDRAKVVMQFDHLNYTDTLCNLLEKLSHDERRKLKHAKSIEELLDKYVDRKEYQGEFNNVARNALNKLARSIAEVLPPAKKREIEALLIAAG